MGYGDGRAASGAFSQPKPTTRFPPQSRDSRDSRDNTQSKAMPLRAGLGFDRAAPGAHGPSGPPSSPIVFVPSRETTQLVNALQSPSKDPNKLEGLSSVKRPFANITQPVRPLLFEGAVPSAPSTPPKKRCCQAASTSPVKGSPSLPQSKPSPVPLQKDSGKAASGASSQKPLKDRIAGRIASMPGLKGIPPRLMSRLLPSAWIDDLERVYDYEDVILCLYAGLDDDTSTKSAFLQRFPFLVPHVLELDIDRKLPYHDVLEDRNFQELLLLAAEGKIRGILGGPNCRTWSILRHFFRLNPKTGKPMPGVVRGRSQAEVWGKDGITHAQQLDVDNDSLLLLRMLLLFNVACEFGKSEPFFLLEHPADPAESSTSPKGKVCSSWWATQQCSAFRTHFHMSLFTFDQCMLGHKADKSTTILTNLNLGHLHGLKCNHPGGHPREGNSKDLARWAWGLNLAIVAACWEFLQGLSAPASEGNIPKPAEDPATHRFESVNLGNKSRIFRDGGGKPSLGRLHPASRPECRLLHVGKLLMDSLSDSITWQSGTAKKTGPLLQCMGEAILNPSKGSPIPLEVTNRIRSQVADLLSPTHAELIKAGLLPQGSILDRPEGQPFYLTLLHLLALEAKDIDCQYPLVVADGVPLGVDNDMLLDPGVWPTKEELGEEPQELEPALPSWQENYTSADSFAASIRETFVEEAALGMVKGPFKTKEEAAEVCECRPEDLVAGSLAAIDEGDKVRTIFDATISVVNEWIRKHSKHKTTAPGLVDLLWARFRLNHQSGLPLVPKDLGVPKRYTLFKSDVSKAHRRIKIKPKDWKFLVAQILQELWVNVVGTYGVASAQLYWGRMASLIVRLVYHLTPDFLWVLVFVDDYMLLLEEEKGMVLSSVFLLFLEVIGCPVSWHKNKLSPENLWVGYAVDINKNTAWLPDDKEQVFTAILSGMSKGTPMSGAKVVSALGKFQWAAKAFPLLAPFLQPLYAWSKKVEDLPQATPGKLVRFLATMMQGMLKQEARPIFPLEESERVWGASDAGANSSRAAIGGWFSKSPDPRQDEVHWFAYELTPDMVPWAYKGVTPKRRIAALEMLGSLVLVKLMEETLGDLPVDATFTAATDNQGNAFSTAKMSARKWPSSAILMEMASWQTKTGYRSTFNHVKRDQNKWADALTNHIYKGFDPALQIKKPYRKLRWLILEDLLDLHESYLDKPAKKKKPQATAGGDGHDQAH